MAAPEDDPDARLLARVIGGDDAAFGSLYSRYLPLVVRWCPRSSRLLLARGSGLASDLRGGPVAWIAPETKPFREQLEVIDVATGQVTKVATGFLSGWGGPTFSPTSSHQLAYANVTKVGRNPSIWSVTPGQASVQLTKSGTDQYPVWGPQGPLYQHAVGNGRSYLDLLSGGHSSTLLKLRAWPVAVSSDGTHLAAESAACGVVWPVSVNLSMRRIVHQFPTSFAPYGISPSGGRVLISGSVPRKDCGGPRSVIETVPFSGGKPRFVAYGTDPSWADSRAVGVQP